MILEIPLISRVSVCSLACRTKHWRYALGSTLLYFSELWSVDKVTDIGWSVYINCSIENSGFVRTFRSTHFYRRGFWCKVLNNLG